MKRVTYADKALLMGDDAAETLLEYARVLTQTAGVDSVTLRCLSTDGDAVDASFLIHGHATLLVESTHSDIAAPDNADAVAELRDRIQRVRQPASAVADDIPWSSADDLGDI